MSWRGVKKSISRLPHQFKTRNGSEDVTRDLEYLELEKRYKETVASADELRLETMSFRDNLANMLNYQFHCANNLAGACGLVMEEDDPLDEGAARYPKREAEDIPPEMKQALEDYATAMAYCREESFSILDDLDAFVVRPADRFQMITRIIDKTITKREHKLIDFDRHRVAYMKYSAISEPSPSEEKNMFKLQTQFDNAAADYDYFNNILKDDLIQFLDLSQDFIEPVFRQFYNIQTRVLGGLYGRLHEVIQHNAAVFPTLNMSIEEGFKARLEEFNASDELDKFELFKSGIKPWQRGNTHSKYAKLNQQQQTQQYSDDDDDLSTQQGYSMNKTLSNHSSNSSLGGGRRSSTSHSNNDHNINDRLPAYSERRPTINKRKSSIPDRNSPLVPERPTYSDRKLSISDRKPSYSSDRKPPLLEKPSYSERRPSISERPSYSDRKPSISERPPISERPLISERPSMNNVRQPPLLSPRPTFATRNRSSSTSNTPPPIRSPSTSVQSTYNKQDGTIGSGGVVRGLQINLTEELNRTFSNASSSAGSSYRSALTPPASTSTSTSTTPPATNEGYRRRNTVSTTTSPFLDDEQKETIKKKRAPPPPPPPSKKTAAYYNRKELVEALYELNAPQDGDLSFRVGDLIEVIEKSDKTHDWWKGRLGERIGMFPANYVRQV